MQYNCNICAKELDLNSAIYKTYGLFCSPECLKVFEVGEEYGPKADDWTWTIRYEIITSDSAQVQDLLQTLQQHLAKTMDCCRTGEVHQR